MLTPAIKDAIERMELLPLATATLDGIPNVVPVKYVTVAADDRLWITDNYLCKTLANLQANPRAALYVWSADPKLCVQIKGDIRLLTDGADYAAMRAETLRQNPALPAKTLVELRVKEIYQCLPSAGPGQKIWPADDAAASPTPVQP